MSSTKLFNLVEMTVSGAPGTGSITLGEATDSDRLTFSEAGVANGDVVSYVVEDHDDIEYGVGTYTSATTTLSRDTVRKSKAGGVSGSSKLDLSHSARVWIDCAAEDLDVSQFTEDTTPAPASDYFWMHDTSAGYKKKVTPSNLAAQMKLSAFAATTSAELSGTISDETGSGALVFGSEPTVTVTATGATSARTLQSRFADEVHVEDFGAVGDEVTDDTAAIQAAITAAGAGGGGTVIFGPKIYKFTATLNIANDYISLRGQGKQATKLLFVPTADDTAININKGGGSSTYYTKISDLWLYSSDTTFTKIGIELVDVRGCYIERLAISGAGLGVNSTDQWEGGASGSTAIHVQGREFIHLDAACTIAAEHPLVIVANPNFDIDFDHCVVDACLIADGHPVVEIGTGVYISNSTFGNSWIGGNYGFYFVDTTSTTTSHTIKFRNLRIENGQDTTAYNFYIDGNNAIQGISFDNVRCDSARRGWFFRDIAWVSLRDCFYPDTTKKALDWDSTVVNLVIDDCFFNTGSTITKGASINTIYAGPVVPAGGPLPGSAWYSTRTADFNCDALSVGTAGTSRGVISMSGNTSGTATIKAQPVAGTAQIDIPLVSGPITTNATAPLAINAVNGTVSFSGLTGLTQGDIIYASAANTGAVLAKDTNSTRYLSNQGTSNNPSWNQVNLANGVTGTLPIANGGTAATTAQAAMAALKGVYILANSAVAASVTGTLTETTLATITVPANAMGANGRVRITTLWTYTNSANNKIIRHKFGGTGYNTYTLTTTASGRVVTEICNRNATNSQVGFASGVGPGVAGSGLGFTSGANVTSAIDTTASVDILITGQLANTGETITLEYYMVELIVP